MYIHSSLLKNKIMSSTEQTEKKSIYQKIYIFVFGQTYIRLAATVIGVLGLCTGLFQFIKFVESCISNGNDSLRVLAFFSTFITIGLIFLAIWYDIHIRLQVNDAKKAINKEYGSNLEKVREISIEIAKSCHKLIEEYRAFYFQNGEINPGMMFDKMYHEFEPVFKQLIGKKNSFDCTIKLIGEDGKLIKTMYRNRKERECKDQCLIDDNYIFVHFKNTDREEKCFIVENVDHEFETVRTQTTGILKRAAHAHGYNSIFAVPLIVRVPDIPVGSCTKKVFIENNKIMIGFIGFDSSTKNFFSNLKESCNKKEHDYGILNYIFFFADLIACLCYQTNLEKIKDTVELSYNKKEEVR